MAAILRPLPSRTLITSFGTTTSSSNSYEQGDWVVDIQVNHKNLLACALCNGTVKVYDASSWQCIQQYYNNNNNKKTHMAWGSSNSDDMLWTVSGNELCGWDGRCSSSNTTTTAAAFTIQFQQPSLLTCLQQIQQSENIIAVGNEHGQVHLVDVRTNNNNNNHSMQCYQDAHAGPVTSLTQMSSQWLCCAGEDGLVNVYDTKQPTPAMAHVHVWNVNAPVRQVLPIITTTNNQSLLAARTGNEQIVFSNGITTTRQDLQVDYLVSAIASGPENNNNKLLVMGGRHDQGPASVFGWNNNNEWQEEERLMGGHQGMIRAWARTNITVTAGEDARLCEWANNNNHTTPARGHSGRKHYKKKDHSPY